MFNLSEALFERGKDFIALDSECLDRLTPCYIYKGKGSYVWDLDGNRYIDYTGARGTIILGYSYPRVDDAVIEQIKRNGNLFFTQYSETKVQLAEMLLRLIPCAERILFFKTGSCATTAAIRIARAYTGNTLVLTSGYHGWHDWALAAPPDSKVPGDNVMDFGYDLNRLEEQIKRHKGRIACVIITPEPNFFDISYFIELRDLTVSNEIILVSDEVKTGFRFSLGGYQKFAEVTPDMATFSKGMANGYSISAVVGQRQVMEAALKTYLWGTYNAELIPMVAALATIKEMEEKHAIEHIWKVGQLLINGMKAIFSEAGIVAEIYRCPSIFHIVFEEEPLGKLFFMEALTRGVFLAPFDNQMVSFSHSAQDIANTLGVLRDAVLAAKLAFRPTSHGLGRTTLSIEALNRYTLREFGGVIPEKIRQ